MTLLEYKIHCFNMLNPFQNKEVSHVACCWNQSRTIASKWPNHAAFCIYVRFCFFSCFFLLRLLIKQKEKTVYFSTVLPRMNYLLPGGPYNFKLCSLTGCVNSMLNKSWKQKKDEILPKLTLTFCSQHAEIYVKQNSASVHA